MSKTRVKILIDDEGRMTLEVDGVLQSHHGYIDIRPTATDGSANRVGCGVVLLGQDPRVAQFTEEVLKGTFHKAAPVVTYLGTAPYTPPFYIPKTPAVLPAPSEPAVPATRIDIDKDGVCQVYVGGQLIGGLLDIHFAALEENGGKAVVLVVPQGDPRAVATAEAVLVADGSKVVSPLYVEQKTGEDRVTEEMAAWVKDPNYLASTPAPLEPEQGRWSRMYAREQPHTPPSKPAIPGPYSATGMSMGDPPELEVKHRFTTDGTKGLKAYVTLNGQELEGVLGWRDCPDALDRVLRVELRVPYGDSRREALPFRAMYKGRLVEVHFKAEDLGESFERIIPKVMDTPTKSTPEERRRAMGLLKEESVRGPILVTPIGPKTAKRRTLNLVLINQVIFQLGSPKTTFVPKLVVEIDGVIQPCTSYHVKRTTTGILWTLYVPDTHPQVGQPDEDILYCGEPAKLRFVYSESTFKGPVHPMPATDLYLAHLQRPIDRTTPEVTFEQCPDGTSILRVDDESMYGVTGTYEEKTPLGPVFFQYVAETDKRLGTPITLVRYQGKPALLVFATKP